MEYIVRVYDYGTALNKLDFNEYYNKVFHDASIMHSLWITTLIVPLALVQYWPLQYLLDRGPWQYGLLPLLSLLFLIPVCSFWKFGVAHYRSTGS